MKNTFLNKLKYIINAKIDMNLIVHIYFFIQKEKQLSKAVLYWIVNIYNFLSYIWIGKNNFSSYFCQVTNLFLSYFLAF